MKRAITYIVLTLIFALFLIGYVEYDRSEDDIHSNAVVYSVNNIPNNLDKVTNLSKRDEDFICATSRGLVEKDSEGNLIPLLAKDIVKKDDGIEYEFILKDNIYWSDGSNINAIDIENFFVELLLGEDEENISALLDIYGAKEFRESKNKSDKDLAMVVEDNKLRIRLNRQNEDFLDELSKPQYRLRESLSDWSNINQSYRNLKYSGEYKINYIVDGSMELKRNSKEEFTGPEEIVIVKDENEELSMAYFEVGDRDIVIDPPSSQLNRLYEEKKLVTVSSDEGTYIYMNDDKESVPMAARRELYKIIYDAAEYYEGENPNRVEVSEGSYFREDKEDITKLQTRKVSINEGAEWKKPDIITMLVEDTDDTRNFCKFLVDWFSEKEGINLRYSIVKKEELTDAELQKRYDIMMFKTDEHSSNREEFYKSLKLLYTDDEKNIFDQEVKNQNTEFRNLEEKLFNSYKVLPVMFSNKNIAISERVSDIILDGNSNILFSDILE